MSQAGKRSKAGQEIRFLDIDVDAGAEMGAFENIGSYISPAAFAHALNDAVERYHGAVGYAWLQHLVKDRAVLTDKIRKITNDFVAEMLPPGAGGQVERVAQRFALVAAAGEVASEYGLTGWEKGEALKSARACFLSWLEGFGGSGNQEERAILSHVKAIFERDGTTRFQTTDYPNDNRVVNRLGFRRQNNDRDGPQTYYVLPEAFKREICKGFNPRTVRAVLLKHGWIVPDSAGKSSRSESLPGLGKTRAYVFGPVMWEEGERALAA